MSEGLGAGQADQATTEFPVAHMRCALREGLVNYDRRRGGWRPQSRVAGRAHLDEALSRGKGAVLWVAPFTAAALGAKVALAAIGLVEGARVIAHLLDRDPRTNALHVAAQVAELAQRQGAVALERVLGALGDHAPDAGWTGMDGETTG